ncbi:MAG: hypothetical protein A2493_00895 [Candidatus Magasanikbacteria bacterium RIFOXYC12_FULL_33_11]|uniref:DUF192 domain-containing protein n=2 Tax=Candidatus Magasanikiibacteriota TaxID=1752731 RepID=A0A1F6NM73_9BACT|nr:MAG: hypothetical protein A2493_00895 [Candidatus Magasanikbacteria bacterium RIFOXYC12_FULL_33_11]PIZ95272.1 MAG: hypothetical protein COX80_04900 [Candidatus Magasanikbacteria bacterium CG_4_10_14_0_2_um_filter_33_14]
MEKKNNFKFYFLIIFVVAAVFLFFWQRFHWPTAQVELKGQTLDILVADSIYRHHKGLGGRESLYPYDGMVFPFSLLDKHAFVMRDMSFPIDIIWFAKGVVVDFAPNVAIEPGKQDGEYTIYRPRIDADMVLEVPAGWSEAYELKIGDKMILVE